MKLQQFPAIAVPFMGQFSALAIVAMRASDNKVLRTIRAAFAKWNDVIDVVILTDLTATPIAASLLRFILALYVVLREIAISLTLSSAPSAIASAPHSIKPFRISILITAHARALVGWIGTIITSLSFIMLFAGILAIYLPALPYLFSVRLFVLSLVFQYTITISSVMFGISSFVGLNLFEAACFLRVTYLFRKALAVGTCGGKRGIAVACITFFGKRTFANFTVAIVSIWIGTIVTKLIQRFHSAAFCAAFSRGIHSVSLSLSRMMWVSGGASDRFSGISLDTPHIVPQRTV